MSVTSNGITYVLNALNDTIDQRLFIVSVALVGTSMSAGDRLTITQNDGKVLFDHYVQQTNEDVELLPGGRAVSVSGLKLTAVPSGTWTIVVRVE